MSLTRTTLDPIFSPGERVTLADDKHARLWVVVATLPGGAVRIQRAGLPASIYTQMNARPTSLKRSTA